MKIVKIVNDKNGQNNYLIMSGKDAVLIDGSAYVSQVEENLKISSDKPTLKAIFLTHEHFDHIAQLDNLIARFNCPVFIHSLGKPCLYKSEQNLSILDVPFTIRKKRGIKTFKDGEEFLFDNMKIQAFHTPGHSMGSSCFLVDDNMFVGDTVFKVDIGRNDLFGGDADVQKISLTRLLTDPAMSAEHYYAGHGSNFEKNDLEYNINHFLGDN